MKRFMLALLPAVATNHPRTRPHRRECVRLCVSGVLSQQNYLALTHSNITRPDATAVDVADADDSRRSDATAMRATAQC